MTQLVNPSISRTRLFITFTVALICAFVLIFAKSMSRPLNPDENVFVAAAALWSRAGLTPYRDFHYNHLPALLFIDGLLFKFSDHLLFISRLFSSICAAILVAIIFTIALSKFTRANLRHPLFFSLLVAILLMCNSLFTLTTGIAWNHDFPTLLMLLAFLCLHSARTATSPPASSPAPGIPGEGWGERFVPTTKTRAPLLLLLSGILLGLAATSRLTFAPSAAAFLVIIFIDGARSTKFKFANASLWLIGFTIAWIPTLYVVAQAPYNAFWGTFLFPGFNTAFHASKGAARISILEKIWFLISGLIQLPGNGALMIAATIVIIPALRHVRNNITHWNRELLGLCVLVLSLLVASYIPSPIFKQYLYAPLPIMVLAWIWTFTPDAPAPRLALSKKLLTIVAAISFAFGFFHYLSLPVLFTHTAWVPMRIHERGVNIRKSAGPGPVLTFAPLVPLEGGQSIFPQLATGPYAFRATQSLTDDERSQLKLSDEQDLVALINTTHPPILLGGAPDLETPLLRTAVFAGYTQQRIPRAGVLLKKIAIQTARTGD